MALEFGLKIEEVNNIDVFSEFGFINGFKHIEIQINNCNKDSFFFSQEFIDKILRIQNRYKLSVSYHGTLGLNYAEKIDRIRETVIDIAKDMLRLCQLTKGKWLTVHIGDCGAERSRKRERLDLAISSFTKLLEGLNDNDTVICLENMPLLKDQGKFFLGESYEDIIYVIEKLNSPKIKALFDVGHANINQSFVPFLEKIVPYIMGIHIHDNFGKNDNHYLVEGGNINWKDFVRIASKVDSDRVIPLIIELKNSNISDIFKSKIILENYLKGCNR